MRHVHVQIPLALYYPACSLAPVHHNLLCHARMQIFLALCYPGLMALASLSLLSELITSWLLGAEKQVGLGGRERGREDGQVRGGQDGQGEQSRCGGVGRR